MICGGALGWAPWRKAKVLLCLLFLPVERGLGFGVWGLGFGVWGLGFGVWGFFSSFLRYRFLVICGGALGWAPWRKAKEIGRAHV